MVVKFYFKWSCKRDSRLPCNVCYNYQKVDFILMGTAFKNKNTDLLYKSDSIVHGSLKRINDYDVVLKYVRSKIHTMAKCLSVITLLILTAIVY